MGNPAGDFDGQFDFFGMWRDGIGIAFVTLDLDRIDKLGEVTFQNGVRVPITKVTDAEGNDVDSWADAYEFHFGNSVFGYGSSLVAYLLFEKGTVH